MAKYYALIGPKLDGPAINSAMTACSIEPIIRQVPRLYVNRMAVLVLANTGEDKVKTKWDNVKRVTLYEHIKTQI